MAKEIQSILPSVAEHKINNPGAVSNNAFALMGQSFQSLGNLINKALDPIVIDQAEKKGLQDRLDQFEAARNIADPSQLENKQPAKLGLGLTAAGRAYNNAFTKMDTSINVAEGTNQLRQMFVEMMKPENLQSGVTSQFDEAAGSIIQGVTDATVKEGQAAVTVRLLEQFNKLQFKLSTAEQAHNKKVMKQAAVSADSQTFGGMQDNLLERDVKTAENLKQDLFSSVDSQVELGILTKPEAAEQKRKVESTFRVFEQVGSFLTAQTSGQGFADDWMVDFVKNPPKNLSASEKIEVKNRVRTLNQLNTQALRGAQAEELARVNDMIISGQIDSIEDINQFELLSPGQRLAAIQKLESQKITDAKNLRQATINQKKIITGQSASIPSSQINTMLSNSVDMFEQVNGRPAGLREQGAMIIGDAGEFNASGVPGVSLGTNASDFDAVETQALKSGDVRQTTEAVITYHNMVVVKGQRNSLNVSGDALAVASLASTLIGRTQISDENMPDIQKSVQLAMNAVFNADDSARRERANNYNSKIASRGSTKLPKSFKDVFGLAPDGAGTDGAFNVFKDVYRAQYISSGSEEAALEATTQAMRAWGTSKHFPDGYVMQFPPENELPITGIGNAFDNQNVTGMQQIINGNKELRDQGFTDTRIEWVSKEQNVDLENLTDEQKVITPLHSQFGELTEEEVATGFITGVSGASAPLRIKVNGFETVAKLMTGPDAPFGDDGKIIYSRFYQDKFGVWQPLENLASTTGVAKFMPAPLAEYAPEMLEEKNKEFLNNSIDKIIEKQDKAEAGSFGDKRLTNVLTQVFASPGIASSLLAGPLKDKRSKDKRSKEERKAELFSKLEGRIKGKPAKERDGG